MKKPGREFYKLFLSFLTLLTLPLLLFGSLYLRSNANVEKRITAAAGDALSRDASTADTALAEIRRGVSMLVGSDTLQALSRIDSPSPGERYDYGALQGELQRLIGNYNGLYDLCIWFPQSRSALNNNARFEPGQLDYLASVYYAGAEFATMRDPFPVS